MRKGEEGKVIDTFRHRKVADLLSLVSQTTKKSLYSIQQFHSMKVHTSKATPAPAAQYTTPAQTAASKSTFVDNRDITILQRKLQDMVNDSPVVMKHKGYQQMADNRPGVVQRMILISPEEYLEDSKATSAQRKLEALKKYLLEAKGIGGFEDTFLGEVKHSIRISLEDNQPLAKERYEEMRGLWEKIGALLIFKDPGSKIKEKEYESANEGKRLKMALKLTNQLIDLHHTLEGGYIPKDRWETLKKEKEVSDETLARGSDGKLIRQTLTNEIYEDLKKEIEGLSQKFHLFENTLTKINTRINDVRKIAGLGIPKKMEKLDSRQNDIKEGIALLGKHEEQLQDIKDELKSLLTEAQSTARIEKRKLIDCKKKLTPLYEFAGLIDNADFTDTQSDIRSEFKTVAIGEGLKKLFIPTFKGEEYGRQKQYRDLIVELAQDNRVLDPENLLTEDHLEKVKTDIPFFTSRMQELSFLKNSSAICIQVGKMNWKELVKGLESNGLKDQAEAIRLSSPEVAEEYNVQLNQVLYSADGILWYPDHVIVAQHKSISLPGNPLVERRHRTSQTIVDSPFKDELRKAANQLAGYTGEGGSTARGRLPEIPPRGIGPNHVITIMLTNVAYKKGFEHQYIIAAQDIMGQKTADGKGPYAWKKVNIIEVHFSNDYTLKLRVEEGGKVVVIE